ncbi:MAG: 1-deoxy-D-xylulose-5-phosphate synthase [Oscillospiraceae bacterium]|nr:1-deoxy-D-xylulose-5-phosphate synthase [Oscillospiraceae bacterium]
MKHKRILRKIKSPEDIKSLSITELEKLCAQIRECLIETVSDTGGHLASNLGVVELTVALHKVFDSPADKLIFDVGHQCYTHKVITGRLDQFGTLRREDGIAGFPRPSESEHDAFITGHASTSVSIACGLCRANMLSGKSNHVIAVIGDGSFTGGMAYEALNNAGSLENLIVILNHNEMSISKNVGTLARYIASLRTGPAYIKAKSQLEKILDWTPPGRWTKKLLLSSKSKMKDVIFGANFFTDLGFIYYGPIDGHNLKQLINVLEYVKSIGKPVFIDIDTIKGKGYSFAEKNPGAFHGVAKFDVETGNPDFSGSGDFSACFGRCLVKLAKNDDKICAITAAMKYGVGMQYFAAAYRERFFDVGIAEQHAVTFAGGLAAGGMTPVFAVYSSFLQRGFDQIIHDTAIDGQHMVLAVDRAGVVGADGETHQGVFDAAFLSMIPNVTVYAPASYRELEIDLHKAIYQTPAVAAVRYPRGKEPEHIPNNNDGADFCLEQNGGKILLATYGTLYSNVYAAALLLKRDNVAVDILRLNKISPLSEKAVAAAAQYGQIFFFEEGIRRGGIGENLLCELSTGGYKGEFTLRAIEDEFVPAAETEAALAKLGLDPAGIHGTVINY